MSLISIPWVERFRPNNFDSIVLDPMNKCILKAIINTGYFPNLLFYGPPGTGKTTTIINLINSYQEKHLQKGKEVIIHLNASDDRGIDVVRNQINQFVNSKTLFNKGMKFVILDEVDYMTKNAQQALRYLIQNCGETVRFCLICNYISRIDEGLQTEFARLKFNQLPEDEIVNFLLNISEKEKLNITPESLRLIQKLYNSDMRSMINFIQSNQNVKNNNICVIENATWENFYKEFLHGKSLVSLTKYAHNISIMYNVDKKNIVKDFLNFIIRNKLHIVNSQFLDFVENITHFPECKNNYYVSFYLTKLAEFIPKEPL